MSVGLVSTVVLALAAGLLTSVKSSQAAKETQEVDAALSSFAESLKGMPYPSFVGDCPTVDDFRTEWGNWTKKWDGAATSIVEVQQWHPGMGTSGEYRPEAEGCPVKGGAPFNPSTQLLRISVEVGDNTANGFVVVSDYGGEDTP